MANNFTAIDDLITKQKTQPVSTPKEAEPIIAEPEYIDIQETVEHEITDEEVKKHVVIRPETIRLPPDLKKLGVQATSSAQFQNVQNIVTPLADNKVVSGLHAPVSSSLRWLATLAWYILKKAHITLKNIHGHVVRIFKK